MGFFKKLFGGAVLDGAKLAHSNEKTDYALIELLSYFVTPQARHASQDQARWGRVLPQSYEETIKLFEKQGWLQASGERYQLTEKAKPFVEQYQTRLSTEKAAILPQVRKTLQAKDTSGALELRRSYEAAFPLGQASWTGPEPQMSHSALTRRILFLQHWLLDGLSKETIAWLKLYAAEQHLWGTSWRLKAEEIPLPVKQELAKEGLDGVEAVYWKAYQMALYVENQETWQRCKGGDHVRRIEIKGPPQNTLGEICSACKPLIGKEYLVVRTPELPLQACTCLCGCLLRYEPVLESYAE